MIGVISKLIEKHWALYQLDNAILKTNLTNCAEFTSRVSKQFKNSNEI